ncbi:MAG: hypothetical protein IJW45_02950 [Oscillospiraceae bacterium]|nr:hypothetical protein [Oscillospiraceae bacterium]
MAKNKTVINIHARNYIHAVFEERLRQEGFRCPDDKLLCWYRSRGEDIVQSIVFYSTWSNMPLMMDIGYSIHPAFTEPVRTSSVHFSNRPWDDPERFKNTPIFEGSLSEPQGYYPFSEDAWVYAPKNGGRGIYTFDAVLLPLMEDVATIEDTYRMHKSRRLEEMQDEKTMMAYRDRDEMEKKYGILSATFIDMALYLDDVESYPYCKYWAQKGCDRFQSLCETYPGRKQYQESLDHWTAISNALGEGGREPYLKELEARKMKNLQRLKKRIDRT